MLYFYLWLVAFGGPPTLLFLLYWKTLFRRAARRLGLEKAPGGYLGEIDGAKVALGRVLDYAAPPWGISITLPEIPTKISLEKRIRTMPRPLDRMPTGDETFDEAITSRSDQATALAVLDSETRAMLLRLKRRAHMRIWNGTVHIQPVGLITLGKIQTLVHEGVAIAKRLAMPPEQLPARLARVALEDPELAVRRRALGALMLSAPDHSGETAQRLLEDRDPSIRSIARLEQDREGALEAALSSNDPLIRDLAVVLMTRRGQRASTEALVAALEPPPGEDLAIAIFRELGAHGAAIALAPLARLTRMLGPEALEAANAALEKIKSRTNLAESAGSLSLAPAAGGEVSIADDQRGGLSVPQD